MLHRRHGGPADEAVAAGQVRPRLVDCVLVLHTVEVLQLPAQGTAVVHGGLAGKFGGFLASISHAIHARLHLAAADGEIHRAILRMNDHIRHRQRAAGDEGFLRGGITGTVLLQMHRVDFPPTPVENEKGVLILGGKLRAVAEDRAGGRAGADVDHRRQCVWIKLRPLARAIAPAPHGAAGHVANARGAVPRSVKVVLHVRVVREQFAIAVKAAVENVAITRRNNLPLFSIRRHLVNNPARSQPIAIVPLPIGHAR